MVRIGLDKAIGTAMSGIRIGAFVGVTSGIMKNMNKIIKDLNKRKRR